MQRQSEFEENRGNVINAVSSPNNSAFGVGLNLDRFFKKKYRDKKKYEQKFRSREEMAYIDYRFSAQLVAFYTGLRDNELRTFMYHYTPSYEWLRKHPTNEEVLDYINTKLKTFRASFIK